jgi:hypothetical protein
MRHMNIILITKALLKCYKSHNRPALFMNECMHAAAEDGEGEARSGREKIKLELDNARKESKSRKTFHCTASLSTPSSGKLPACLH